MPSKNQAETVYTPEDVERKKLLGKLTARHVRRLCAQWHDTKGKKGIRCFNVGTGKLAYWKIPESAIKEFKNAK